ncbi:MAG: GNAT family N-acetyltransferase [Calditrichaeota bacterium]|nr:MAG: GNAT family N-acetyltransferase [Calditrichota bacterium]
MKIEIRKINPEETFVLRQKILRPNQTLNDCQYSGDLEKSSSHFGAFANNKQIGIASIYNQNEKGEIEEGIWRIRGMAVLEEFRGSEIGAKLLQSCIKYAKSQNAKNVWCNGRSTVVGFYSKFGFSPKGEEFEIEGIGPHFVMEINLQK